MLTTRLVQPMLRRGALSRAMTEAGAGGGLSESVLPEYEGIVATRGTVATRKHLTNTRSMGQSRHIARADLTGLKVVVANWWATNTVPVTESGTGAAMTVTASISTDLVTWTPFQWSGTGSGSIPDGTTLASDHLPFVLTDGQTFYIRMWRECAGGMTYCEIQGDISSNEKFLISTTAVDSTGGAAFTGNSNGNTGGPVAIIGQTTKPSVLIIGDSISYGTGDTPLGSPTGDYGRYAPSLGARYGYIMAARPSDAAGAYLATGTRRTALQVYASHVVTAMGRNDLDAGWTAEQLQTDLSTLFAQFTKPVWADTIIPRSTSTDAWATVANQSTSANNPTRITVNDWLKTVPAGLTGVFNSCLALENDPANNDGKWPAGTTNDGIHPNKAGYDAIKASGAINPLRL